MRYFRGNKIPSTFCLYSGQLRLFVDLCGHCVVAWRQQYSNEMRDLQIHEINETRVLRSYIELSKAKTEEN